MSFAELDGDTTFLSRMLSLRYPPAPEIDEDLERVFEALQAQVNIASLLRIQWKHIKDESTLAGVAEQILGASRCLRTAEVTREKITRLGSRYILTNLIFWKARFNKQGYPIGEGELSSKSKSVLKLMNEQRMVLEATIQEIEKYLAEIEKTARKRELVNNAAQLGTLVRMEVDRVANIEKEKSTTRYSELQEMIQRQSVELSRLKEKMAEKERGSTRSENDNNNDETPKAESNENCERENLDDNAYWERMVEEVSGLEEPPKEERVKSADISKPVKNSKTEGVEEKGEPAPKARKIDPSNRSEPRSRVRVLEDWIMVMENDIQKFPYRKSEVWSQGIDPRMQCSFCDLTGEHFSDSCSVYTDSSVRHNIVVWKGLCDICLDYCSRTGECRTTLRPCWYCVRVKETCFSDLAKKDYRHHRALCDVPDKRKEARRRIEAAKRELDELRSRSGGPSRSAPY
ncbi:unnamed protein product [Heligmosomoides polygyrus]|uniref:MYND-type domain-containing protein n=1 Tax=Heligmosomoides polygyrus TaxID=6339 RepID=A0A183GJJ2_HELPZ|nr:unnamed protein product [Heligmosomoides polygyrus]